MQSLFTRCATTIATASGQPATFLLAVGTVLVWAFTGPVFNFSDTWQLVINTGTTVVTFLMVFLIQNSQNRDGAAMQAKLDELLRAVENARTQFIGIEHLNDHQIDMLRSALERHAREDKDEQTKKKDASAEDTVDRLLRRF